MHLHFQSTIQSDQPEKVTELGTANCRSKVILSKNNAANFISFCQTSNPKTDGPAITYTLMKLQKSGPRTLRFTRQTNTNDSYSKANLPIAEESVMLYSKQAPYVPLLTTPRAKEEKEIVENQSWSKVTIRINIWQ